MKKEIHFTKIAIQDLQQIMQNIVAFTDVEEAQKIFNKFNQALQTLSTAMEQPLPMELSQLGIKEFQQINVENYRLIFRVLNKKIYIYTILDERIDIAKALEQCLLR